MANKITSRSTRRQPINEPATKYVEVIWSAYLLTGKNGQGENYDFSDKDEVATYNADPDGFAAKHFGFDDVDDYREWVACSGVPLCSERTKAGKVCANSIGQALHYSPREWLAFHRSEPCHKHGGAAPGEGQMPPSAQTEPRPPGYSRKRRYPPPEHRRCEVIVKPPSFWNGQAWQWGSHRCGLSGTFQRNGHRVCRVHRDCGVVAFVDEGAP